MNMPPTAPTHGLRAPAATGTPPPPSGKGTLTSAYFSDSTILDMPWKNAGDGEATSAPRGWVSAGGLCPSPLCCPSRKIFSAALWSRCNLIPQSGQECHRTDKLLTTIMPQPEQACEV